MVCNSGTSLVPTIDGTPHHFNNVGLYDALFVMQDAESKTLWRHIDGAALYGPMVGRTLGPVGNLLQMNVKQALALDTRMQVAISDRPYLAGGRQFGTAGGRGGRAGRGGPGTSAQLAPMFEQTLGKEDTRRPRMDMGLGIWTSATRRYYPMDMLSDRHNAFIDEIDGRKVLIYLEPETATPAAMFVNATNATREGGEVRLDDGTVVRLGVLLGRDGKPGKTERPQQIFTRWYGFALTFPGCEVAGN